MREYCEELAMETGESLIFWDGFDDAIVGVIEVEGVNRVVYSEAKCIHVLLNEMSEEEAIDYFYTNMACCYLGEHTPVHLKTPEFWFPYQKPSRDHVLLTCTDSFYLCRNLRHDSLTAPAVLLRYHHKTTHRETEMPLIADTPKPPYYAVIFTSVRTEGDNGYSDVATRMLELAEQEDGFLGVESAREEAGITVSYWSSLEAIRKWKANGEHLEAQRTGRAEWYEAFKVRISLVERDYGM